ncbi:hypothetical protein EBQ90_12425 [bacterium]|nr:hypothetical protein [bacterium]
MRAEKQWVDHPEAKTNNSKRPHLRLVANPPEAPPDSPSDKALKSISERAEVVLVILAQAALILGLFMASQFMV